MESSQILRSFSKVPTNCQILREEEKKRKNEQKVTFIKGERKNGKTVKRCTNLCNVMNNSFLVIFIVVYRQHVEVGNKNKGAKVMNLAL